MKFPIFRKAAYSEEVKKKLEKNILEYLMKNNYEIIGDHGEKIPKEQIPTEFETSDGKLVWQVLDGLFQYGLIQSYQISEISDYIDRGETQTHIRITCEGIVYLTDNITPTLTRGQLAETMRTLYSAIELGNGLFIPQNKNFFDYFRNRKWLPLRATQLDSRGAKKALEELVKLGYLQATPQYDELRDGKIIKHGTMYNCTEQGSEWSTQLQKIKDLSYR